MRPSKSDKELRELILKYNVLRPLENEAAEEAQFDKLRAYNEIPYKFATNSTKPIELRLVDFNVNTKIVNALTKKSEGLTASSLADFRLWNPDKLD